MIAKNVSQTDLMNALLIVSNRLYDGNVIFKNLAKIGNRYSFTLRVKDSKKPGHRLHINRFGGKNRRTPAACWHVHGDFFEALFSINPNAEIQSSGPNGKMVITKHNHNNWTDWNVGSQVFPVFYSESCECDN
jgi:hypothetical protein